MQLQQIAERCQQGDREAFALLYTAMSQPLRAVCMRYVQNESVADDLLHDAFLLIFTKIGELKDTSCVEAWMHKVAQHVALLYLRQQKQHVTLAEAKALTTGSHAEPALALQEILAAVDALPEGYRRVFRLSVLEGMTHQEIAALLNIEPHSSSSQLYHAKALLRRWLRPMVLVLLAAVLPLGIYMWKENTKKAGKKDNVVENITGESGKASPKPHTPKNESENRPLIRPLIRIRTQQPTAKLLLNDSLTENTGVDTTHVIALTEQRDTVKAQPVRMINHQAEPERVELKQTNHSSQWMLALAYSGIGGSKQMQLPYADRETNPMVYDSVAHHHIPLTVSLMLNRRLSRHWQVGIGVNYQRMTSDMLSGNSYVSLSQHQLVQYIGIPVSISWHYPLGLQFSTYISVSASFSLPLRSTLESVYVIDGHAFDSTTERLHPGVLWSTGIGLGLQYNVTPHIGFFAEPSLQYHFNNGHVKTWNTEHPFNFTIPFGLRISF